VLDTSKVGAVFKSSMPIARELSFRFDAHATPYGYDYALEIEIDRRAIPMLRNLVDAGEVSPFEPVRFERRR